MNPPTLYSYGRGTKGTQVNLDGLTLWFSYKTIVAFQVWHNPTVVHENIWGTTTGGHLNSIDGGDRKNRVSTAKFADLYSQGLAKMYDTIDGQTHTLERRTITSAPERIIETCKTVANDIEMYLKGEWEGNEEGWSLMITNLRYAATCLEAEDPS